MSFSLKKNNGVTYIAQNNATTNPSSDNWLENGTNIYNNNTGGNVGINTSNPQNSLDVNGILSVRTENIAKLVLGGFGGTTYKNGAYSLDGVNFIPYTSSNFSPANSAGSSLECFAYSPELKIWVGGGGANAGFSTLVYSYDGINWNASPNSVNYMRRVLGIAYSSSQRRFVIVGGRTISPDFSTTTIAYSNDGINWINGSPNTAFGVEGRGVAYSPTLNRWVATGRDQTYYSNDGINWTLATTAITGDSVAWMGGSVNKFIMVNNIAATISNTLSTSSDGITWTGLGNTLFTNSVATNNVTVAVNPENTLAVVVGSGPNGGLAYTTDASNFTFVSGLPSNTYNTVTYSSFYNAWFAARQTSPSIITSSNGINWTSVPFSSTLLTQIYTIGALQEVSGYVPTGLKMNSNPAGTLSMYNINNVDISANAIVRGNLTVDTNALVVDASNNRVGINTSNPAFNLDVSGTTNITGNLTVDTNALFVDASNNRVGINTSNPDFNLDVSGNSIVRGNLHQSVLYLTGGSNNLTTLSPNSIIVFAGNVQSFVVLPTITSSNDGLTFKISGFFSGTTASNSYIQRSGSSLIYFQKSTTGVTQFSFTDLSPATLVAYNSNWYVV